MPISHLLLALIVVIAWGINFLFVKIGLEEIAPLTLCAVRFILASIPAIFFIKPPKESFRIVAGYGLIMFALQFSLLFLGMHIGMTPGMGSLLLQVQVFFSMFFAAVILNERPYIWQIIGAFVSFLGIALVALHFDAHVTLLGFLCILASAATWGFGNLITKKAKTKSMMSIVVWGSFIAAFPMILLALIFEGPQSMIATIHHISWKGISAVFYIVYISTWVGYGIWNWLISRYPISMVAPFALLVPIIAIISSVIVLGEPMQSWKIVAAILVLGGLGINLLGKHIFTLLMARKASVPGS